MPAKVRIGIIGGGFAAHFHLASYAKVVGQNFEIAAICDSGSGKAKALAAQFGVPTYYGSIDELLADPSVDVVDICVPNHLHMPLAARAAAAGKHVICEKPLGGFFGPEDAGEDWNAKGYSRLDMLQAVIAEAKQVKAALDASGVTFCYGENWVYAPPIVKLNRLLAASDSTVMRIRGEESHSGSHSKFSRRWRTAGGGALLRLCVHPLGAALWLKAEEGRRRNGAPIRPASVVASVGRLTEIASFQAEEPKHIVTGWVDVEDWGSMIVTFEDGSVGEFTSTDTHMGGIHNYLTAYGSRAVVTANINPNDTVKAYTPAGRYFESEYIVEKTETKEGWSFPAPDEDSITGYPHELRDFIDAIANGRKPHSDFDLAYQVLVTVYAAYLSAETGERVELGAMLAG